MKRFCCLLWMGWLMLLYVSAQSNQQFFLQQLDNRNGLSNSAINHIYTDADNLLWVATWDGLNMYDGSNFHVFNYNRGNSNRSIGSNVIQHIVEGNNGNIWFSTIEGISRYDKDSGRFHNYFYNQPRQSRISEKEYQIAADTAGNIYCLSQKQGLLCYNAAADSFINCQALPDAQHISSMLFDANNQLWYIDKDGNLSVGLLQAGKFTLKKKNILTQTTGIFKANGQLFCTTNNNQLWHCAPNNTNPEAVINLEHPVSSILYYQNHYLLAKSSKGATVLDGHFKPTDFLSGELQPLQDIHLTALTTGSEQTIWAGTDGSGIMKLYPKTKSFGTVASSNENNNYSKPVRAFCEANGQLLIATKGSGIIAFNQFYNGGITTNRQTYTAPAQLDNNAVFCLQKNTDGLIYIGSDGRGIGIYHPLQKKFYKWAAISGSSSHTDFGSVYAILPDADSSVWLGTSGYGLVHLRLKTSAGNGLMLDYVERFPFTNKQTGPANDIIYSLAADGNQIWMACRYGGLSVLNKTTKTFRSFKAQSYEGALSNNDALAVFKDSRQRIWVGTSYGLNQMTANESGKPQPLFQKFTTDNGLPNNTIHAITEDNQGNIWVSTNKGLAKVSADGQQILDYQHTDGLQSNEFCDGAVWKEPGGRLFFGGIYGFNHFLPAAIGKSNWLPNLLVSNLSLSGKRQADNWFTVLHPQQNNTPFYAIERKDDFFELDVKALSYLNAEKCEYAYFLEGYDKAWHQAGNNGKISYSNIRSGNFLLKIKWSNGEGVWTNETVLMQLKVHQYFWLTKLAFAFYAVLLTVIIYVVYNYRKNRQLIKRELELEHLLRTKEEEMHQNRLAFFTNIAHELQTPLTLIMGSIERFMEKTLVKGSGQKPYFLSTIHQQASRLTLLVQQLLEFRRAEAGHVQSQQSFLDISGLLQNLAEPFRPIGEQSRISYEIDIATGIIGNTDKDKLEKIVFNLLSNAFKHSPADSQVAFKVKADEASLMMTVSNSGVELQPGQLAQLFQNFYKEGLKPDSGGHFGTGIGLAFTREMVRLMGGDIKASSANNWLHFTVNIPLEKSTSDNTAALPAQPSYLYESITSYNETPANIDVARSNQHALIDELSNTNQPSILLVEDEPEIRYLLKDILKDDYIIYEAGNGNEALEHLQQWLPDLIICDVMMPVMSGLELCEKVKSAPATCHIPFIILSARDSIEHHTEGYEMGADAYIPKPFHTNLLKVRIRKMLENKQRLHQLFQQETSQSSIANADLPDTDKQLLQKLVACIEEHIDEPEFGAEQLEKAMLLSKMQLYRKLKTLTGMTPNDFIKQVRLKQAAALLSSTQLTVAEIFYRTGFNNQSYFFREFKKKYGCPPNEYREGRVTLER